MEKYMNEYEKECYRGVEPGTPFDELEFHDVTKMLEENGQQVALHTNLGSLTVLNRLTGFGWRDIESGYRDTDGKFWLASGGFDVRESGAETMQQAIEWVKKNANTCVGV